MNNKNILGIVLILIGAGILIYQQVSYRSRETVIDIGPIKATAERTKTVDLPPILGWILVAGGTVVLVVGARSKA